VAQIVTCAWALAAEHGIAGVSLRMLAREVGMRQPSLYTYFDSKHALFDAMFADGNRRLLERLDALTYPEEPRAAVRCFTRAFTDFALEDPARCALLFQRPIPGFEPSADAYRLAGEILGRGVELLGAAGVVDPGDVDCYTAIVGGVIDAQMANDPGGDRYTRHLDRLIDLYLDDVARRAACAPT
jgi:AcrR family transcriptional regulator